MLFQLNVHLNKMWLLYMKYGLKQNAVSDFEWLPVISNNDRPTRLKRRVHLALLRFLAAHLMTQDLKLQLAQ